MVSLRVNALKTRKDGQDIFEYDAMNGLSVYTYLEDLKSQVWGGVVDGDFVLLEG